MQLELSGAYKELPKGSLLEIPTTIQKLKIENLTVNVEDLDSIKKNLDSLTSLKISNAKMNPIEILKRLPEKVIKLDLSYTNKMKTSENDEFVDLLPKKLEKLYLQALKLNDEQIKRLPSTIKRLSLSTNAITYQCDYSRFEKLQTLSLRCTNTNNESVKMIPNKENMTKLSLCATEIDDQCLIETIPLFKNLTVLDLGEAEGIEENSNFKFLPSNLQYFYVRWLDLDNTFLHNIQHLHNLKYLHVTEINKYADLSLLPKSLLFLRTENSIPVSPLFSKNGCSLHEGRLL